MNRHGTVSAGVNVQAFKPWIENKGVEPRVNPSLVDPQAVPEPSGFLLALSGLGAVFLVRRKRAA